MCKAYNEWAYEYCQEDPQRLFFAALLPMQDPVYAAQEVRRVAAKGCRVGLVRPIDAMGNYPVAAQVRAGVAGDGGDRGGVRHASLSGHGRKQTAGL